MERGRAASGLSVIGYTAQGIPVERILEAFRGPF